MGREAAGLRTRKLGPDQEEGAPSLSGSPVLLQGEGGTDWPPSCCHAHLECDGLRARHGGVGDSPLAGTTASRRLSPAAMEGKPRPCGVRAPAPSGHAGCAQATTEPSTPAPLRASLEGRPWPASPCECLLTALVALILVRRLLCPHGGLLQVQHLPPWHLPEPVCRPQLQGMPQRPIRVAAGAGPLLRVPCWHVQPRHPVHLHRCLPGLPNRQRRTLPRFKPVLALWCW